MNNDSISSDQNVRRLELKYCERCGGLWFRECGRTDVYCGRCLPEIGELPAPWEWPNSSRPASTASFDDVADFEIDESGADDIGAVSFPAIGGAA